MTIRINNTFFLWRYLSRHLVTAVFCFSVQQGLLVCTSVATAATPDQLVDESSNKSLKGIRKKKSQLKQAQTPQTQTKKSANPLAARYVPSLHIDSYPTDVTVTASRRPTRLSDIGTQATIVTEKQILVQQRRELSTVLTRQPGLTVVRTGGFGGSTSIFMRGNNSNAIRVRGNIWQR